MFENFDWNLIFVGVGALFAACLFFVELYQAYQKYVAPKKEKKRSSEKAELDKKISHIREVESLVKRSLEERVENNSFPKMSNVPWTHAPSEFQEKGEEYDEIYDRCIDWKEACKDVITVRLQELSCEYLPKTCKEHDFVGSVNNDELRNRYMNAEEVTKHLIEKEYPTGLYATIMENLIDKENKLDLFFLKLNETFQKNAVLERFRKEKKKLVDLAHSILKDLKKEEEKLQNELDKC